MAFDYIRSSFSTIGSRFRMGNDQSQESVPEQASLDEVFDPDSISSDSGSETVMLKNSMAGTQAYDKSPPQSQSRGSSAKKRKRKRTRLGRSSTGPSASASDPMSSEIVPDSQKAISEVGGAHVTQATGREAAQNEDDGISENDGIGEDDEHGGKEGRFTNVPGQQRLSVNGQDPTVSQVEGQFPAQLMNPDPREVPIDDEEPQDIETSRKGQRVRYPCPKADTYNCRRTFTMMSAAKRHERTAHALDGKLQCPVCSKTYSRIDGLRKHKLLHSAEEFRAAEPATDGSASKASKLGGEVTGEIELENHFRGSDQQTAKGSRRETDSQDAGREDLLQDQISPRSSKQASEGQSARSAEAIAMQDTLEHSSDKPSASSDSVFDVAQSEETPRPKAGLKRRRDMMSGGRQTPGTTGTGAKRRRNILSPPTSMTSDDDAGATENRNLSQQIQRQPAQLKKQGSNGTGNLDAFAKPLGPGSQLYHPIHNPRSPKIQSSQNIQIVVPRTSRAGPSSSVPSQKRQQTMKSNHPTLDDDETPLARKTTQSVYTSSKGKRRAEPGVDYSTPSKQPQNHSRNVPTDRDEEPADEEEDDNDESNPQRISGFATSVARRTNSQPNSKSTSASGQKKRKRTSEESESSGSASGVEHGEAEADGEQYLCQGCQRKFKSREALRRHEKKKDVHKTSYHCSECDLAFPSMSLLREHEEEIEHGDGTGYAGRKGNFSPGEVGKLERWRDNFCEENSLSNNDFNQMMTDTCRRGKGFVWPYRFVTKANLMQEYYAVLPNRNRRSMNRYRERAFQNVPEKQEWTKEDDDDLVRLYKQMGPKWVEIGQQMMRTQDSVSQRWRHKLQYRGKAIDGEWLSLEVDRLIDAVNHVKRESDLPLDPNAEVRIPWELVSRRLKGKRTAQQCSNKWRLMNMVRVKGKFIYARGLDRLPGRHSALSTPSKMSQRLAGTSASNTGSQSRRSSERAKRRKYTSKEIVVESEDEDNSTPENNGELDHDSMSGVETSATSAKQTAPARKKDEAKIQIPADDETSESGSEPESADEEETDENTGSPELPHKRFSTKTPGKTTSLSQVFNNTQANTSAIRATTTARKNTQTERPSPSVSVRARPESSPLGMISTIPEQSTQKDSELQDGSGSEKEEAEAKSGGDLVDVEASEASSEEEEVQDDSRGDDDENFKGDVQDVEVPEAAQSSEEETATASESASSSSGSGSESESDSDSEPETQNKKTSFLESLKSSRPQSASQSGASSVRSKKFDLTKAVRGGARDSSSDDDSDSGSDEGDIMHH